MTDTRHDKSKSIVGRLFAICAFTLAVCGCGGGIGGGIGGGGRRVDIGGGVIIDMVPIDAPSGVCYMQKTEVTQALWKSVMGENPSYFKGDDRPVECVSWNDCQSFIEKLNGLPSVGKSGLVFRLPTEEEWEYACRAGSAGDYCKLADGSEITEETLGTVAWYDDNSNDETHPVGQKQPNAFGLYDMHGNVWEWTSTPGGGDRVFRGGCWYGNAGYCTCGFRYGDNPGRRDDALGLRLVMTADEMSAIAELTGQMVDVPGKDYKMCKYEVTQALWKSVMGENPSRFKGDDRPVECVSWNDCQSFIEKLNGLPSVRKSGLVFRLPTEEEWEHACRAGSAGDYCKLADGTEITEDTLESVAWYGEDWENGSTHSVGQKQPNAFGLHDMHGNVWVWTSTADGGLRVVRGGSWYNLADDCTCGNRGRLGPDDRDDNIGLRLAASAGL